MGVSEVDVAGWVRLYVCVEYNVVYSNGRGREFYTESLVVILSVVGNIWNIVVIMCVVSKLSFREVVCWWLCMRMLVC